MEPVSLFDLAAKQAQWLSVRQSAIAGNIANANTPGYTANDVEPFEKVLDRTAVSLQTTEAGHLGSAATNAGFTIKPQVDDGVVLPSKNSVVLEDQLLKAGEVRRSFELNTAIVKAFHSMMMMAVKS
ncbi:flagellar basal body rod protein FlgB [Mesorhizobium sp. dw_380]|uniref:flagellar basal body rod protein FlgB n=1 Tax=Mesorhizobium sp. dw_380 TaxID=2812001 RepID=UPI001BDE5D53|nr:flagellar basal body rod protein FlgB [Mesorhizobium sp. dw_380]